MLLAYVILFATLYGNCKTTLHGVLTYAMLSLRFQTTIHTKNPVQCCLNTLRIAFSSQCCLNKKTKKITCWMLAQSTQSFFCGKITYKIFSLSKVGQQSIKQVSMGKYSIILSGSIWANIVQGNHLCNVDPWLTDNFYDENKSSLHLHVKKSF